MAFARSRVTGRSLDGGGESWAGTTSGLARRSHRGVWELLTGDPFAGKIDRG